MIFPLSMENRATKSGFTMITPQEYLHLELDEASREIFVINTLKGLYRFNRLAFGIASTPASWQKDYGTDFRRDTKYILENLLGLECVEYCDDVIYRNELFNAVDKIRAIMDAAEL
ncbi:K02A2.6-like [Cordylochernes scorpioides]|uniref:K02A2.6-like n=1 Tax=Cordylochernes scorpioides TaxID=51811 RepID=A0ABY6L8Z6_9ARAC|nr:K02A2.6-like [Cordylochernes scorpioides]